MFCPLYMNDGPPISASSTDQIGRSAKNTPELNRTVPYRCKTLCIKNCCQVSFLENKSFATR